MKSIYSIFLISFSIVSLLMIIMSILILFFERKFIGIAQKRLGISFLGRNGWLHLPADIIKFWSKSSFKNSSFWVFSSFNLFLVLCLYYIWNLLSLVFFINNQNSLNYDFSTFQIIVYLVYANLTTLYLFFIIINLKSKYAVIGGLRIILVNIFLEFSFILNFYSLYIYSGGFSFDDFSTSNSWSSFFCSLPISSFIFIIYTLYEAKRAPFDHAEAESELVAGHLIEFSGKSLLFFFFSEYLHLYFCIYLLILFLFGNLETFIFLQFLFSGESLYSSNTYFLEPLTIDQLYFLY
jgi:NADH-quinone oxidoreductase subunit H